MFINVKNVAGETPLFFACFVGYLDTVRLLVENGADVNIKSHHEETPLMYAVKKGYYPIVEYLVSKNVYLDEQDKDGNTSLILSCLLGKKASNKEDYIKCATILIDAGANVNIQNNDGDTALFYSVLLPSYNISEMIIRRSNMEVESIL